MNAGRLTTDDLLGRHRSAEMEAVRARDSYTLRRDSISEALAGAGMDRERMDVLFQSYERLVDPEFGAAGWRHLANNETARRFHDEAMRSGISPDDWALYTGALKDWRLAENWSNAWASQIYSVGGTDMLKLARTEAQDLLQLRGEVLANARRMFPAVDVDVVHNMVEDRNAAGPARYDPLRRLLSVSLDMTDPSFEPRQAAYHQLWLAVEPLLGEKERKVLEAKYLTGAPQDLSPAEKAAGIAEAFSDWMEPDRRRTRGIDSLFRKVHGFFESVGNAARGRGFQNAEDVLSRARSGAIGARDARQGPGIRIPDKDPRSEVDSGHRRATEATGALSEHQLAKAIRDQKRAVDASAAKRRSAMRRLTVYNPAVRGFKSVVGYFGTEGRDALREDVRELRELQRGLAVLMAEKHRREDRHISTALGLTDPSSPAPGGQAGHDGQAISLAGLASEAIGVEGGAYGGVHGTYTVTPGSHPAPDGDVYPLRVDLQPHGGGSLPVGLARDAGAAGAVIDSFDRVVGEGRSSLQARSLAQHANLAGLGDIDLLKASGMIDERLDKLIGNRDAYALAYPLKTGEMVFLTDDKTWRAATMGEFVAYAQMRGDQHLQAAAEVVSAEDFARRRAETERTRDGAAPVVRTRDGEEPASERVPPAEPTAPSTIERNHPTPAEVRSVATMAADIEDPGPPSAPAGAVRPIPRDDRDETAPASMAARTAAQEGKGRAEPFKSTPGREDQAVQQLRKFPVEELKATLAATLAAIDELGDKKQSPAVRREQLEYKTGMTALETVCREKNIPIPQTMGQSRETPPRKGKDDQGR